MKLSDYIEKVAVEREEVEVLEEILAKGVLSEKQQKVLKKYYEEEKCKLEKLLSTEFYTMKEPFPDYIGVAKVKEYADKAKKLTTDKMKVN